MELQPVGWSRATELAKVAKRDGQKLDSATWLHKARELPKEEYGSASFPVRCAKCRAGSCKNKCAVLTDVTTSAPPPIPRNPMVARADAMARATAWIPDQSFRLRIVILNAASGTGNRRFRLLLGC